MADKNIHHSDDNHHAEPHMGILRNVGIFAILFVLTIVTYYVSLLDLDGKLFHGANTLVALLIAFFKMSCVVLFFMHVWWNKKLIWLTFAGTFVFLLIMFAFTMQDFLTRQTGIFTK